MAHLAETKAEKKRLKKQRILELERLERIRIWNKELPERNRLMEAARLQEASAQERVEQELSRVLLKEGRACVDEIRRLVYQRTVIVDSSVWMKDKYISFLNILGRIAASSEMIVVVPSVQFDEIENLKDRETHKETKFRARQAFSHIEYFSDLGILSIQGMEKQARRGAYADPVFLDLLIRNASSGTLTLFITEDKSLRIRAKTLLAAKENLTVHIKAAEDLAESATVAWLSYVDRQVPIFEEGPSTHTSDVEEAIV